VLGETEVDELRGAANRHEDVRRFDVAMEDALPVRRIEAVSDL
jgi:hypothetical protein